MRENRNKNILSVSDSVSVSRFFSGKALLGMTLMVYGGNTFGQKMISSCSLELFPISDKEFRHLSLVVDDINDHGLPKELTNA